MDNTKKSPTVLAFCAGYGGIERGLDLARVKHRVLTYVEIEAYAIANLVAKMETNRLAPAPIYTDLKTFPAHLFRDRVDIITGGYPCQPFSAAGQRKGTDDPRHLWPFIKRHIETIRPVRCFFENVEGHISLGLREVIEDLESLGYSTTWGIFSAAEVGAPHQRKRVYILAHASRDFIRQQSRWSSGENGQSTPFSGIDGETQPLANSDSERLEGRVYRSGVDTEGRQKQEIRRSTECGNRGSWDGHQGWSSEPSLGRVVDGCADRVDRLRLLGNGVVPQTAAKAWAVLNNQLRER